MQLHDMKMDNSIDNLTYSHRVSSTRDVKSRSLSPVVLLIAGSPLLLDRCLALALALPSLRLLYALNGSGPVLLLSASTSSHTSSFPACPAGHPRSSGVR